MAGGTRNERVIVDIIVKSQGAQRSLSQMNKSLKSVEKSSKSAANNLQFFRDVTGLATMAIMLHDIAKSFIQVNIAQQRVEKGFTAVTKSATGATEELAYTSEVAERLGLNFYEVSKSWLGVMAAAKGSTITTQEARTVFEAFAGTMSKLGKSQAEVNGVLLAVQQIFSKGVISAEEWKNQIGERLPGAMALLADSLKKTTGEVMKMMEAGEIASKQLVAVAEDLADLYDTGDRMEGLLQDWNRLGNAIDRVMVALGKAGVIDAITDGISMLGRAIETLSNHTGTLTIEQAKLVGIYEKMEGTIPGVAAANFELGNAYKELISLQEVLGVRQGTLIDWLRQLTGLDKKHAALLMQKADRVEFLKRMLEALVAVEDERRRKLELMNKAEAESARMKEYQIQRAKELVEEEKRLKEQDKIRAKGLREDETLAKRIQDIQRLITSETNVLNIKEASLTMSEDELKIYKQKLELETKLGRIQAMKPKFDPSLPDFAEREANWDQATSIVGKMLPQIASDDFDRDKQIEQMEKVKALADDIGYSFAGAFEDIILGTESVSDAFENMARSIAASIVKTGFTDPLAKGISGVVSGLVGSMFGAPTVTASANGNAFSGSTGLAHGVYNQPTAFPINGGGRFANGVGIMGEAGAEAILPLTRRGGKLGVEGGGGVNINVQNYAGADVQTRQGINPGDIDIIISRVADDVARGGGPVGRSIESTYGVARGKGRR